MILSRFRVPSAWLPIAMSFPGLALVVGHVLLAGSAREPDEGTAAHLRQLLMVGQVPVGAWFAIRWFPKGTRQAIAVLAVQVVAIVVAATPVALFGL